MKCPSLHPDDLGRLTKAQLIKLFVLVAGKLAEAESLNLGNCSGHLSTLFLAIRNDARSHIGAVAARMSETAKTVEFMAGSANLDRKLT